MEAGLIRTDEDFMAAMGPQLLQFPYGDDPSLGEMSERCGLNPGNIAQTLLWVRRRLAQ